MDGALWILAAITQEALLFAAVGFLIGGIDDLLVDLLYLVTRLTGRGRTLSLGDLPRPERPGRIALFVPAWDEVAVIGPMLDAALGAIDHPDYRIYVGVYPNDPATQGAVAAVAARDNRIRLVIGPRAGPTTKGDNLNAMWRALVADDARTGVRTDAVVLHDAEDLVHPAELRVFDALLARHAVIQLPVHPLIRPEAHWVGGTYADEFAEAHGKALVVRSALGAGLPLAGVGCAVRRDALDALARTRGGAPFDPGSLVEDYETGLHLAGLGYTGCFARVTERPGGAVVATRAYFPDTLETAVRQKARWMTGIALAGWDRIGWARPLALGDHWMRARDRRAPVAALVLAAAYLALPLWAASEAAHRIAGAPTPPLDPVLGGVLHANLLLLGWRLASRVLFTGRAYGWREGLRAAPRMVVGNLVALLAVRRAAWRYWAMLRGSAPVWDKTEHRFPDAGVRRA